jgi:hypothetical protein
MPVPTTSARARGHRRQPLPQSRIPRGSAPAGDEGWGAGRRGSRRVLLSKARLARIEAVRSSSWPNVRACQRARLSGGPKSATSRAAMNPPVATRRSRAGAGRERSLGHAEGDERVQHQRGRRRRTDVDRGHLATLNEMDRPRSRVAGSRSCRSPGVAGCPRDVWATRPAAKIASDRPPKTLGQRSPLSGSIPVVQQRILSIRRPGAA